MREGRQPQQLPNQCNIAMVTPKTTQPLQRHTLSIYSLMYNERKLRGQGIVNIQSHPPSILCHAPSAIARSQPIITASRRHVTVLIPQITWSVCARTAISRRYALPTNSRSASTLADGL